MYAADYDLAGVAKVIGEPARAAMLLRLMDGQAHTASDLAAAAGVTPSTASTHLSHLLAAGLVTVSTQGRRRLHALASADVAAAIEALGCIAPLLPVESLKQARAGSKLQIARVCYSHLGGALAVGLTRRLIDDGAVTMDAGRQVARVLTLEHPLLASLAVTSLAGGSGPAIRGCLDWTEQQPHVAGRLGTAMLSGLLGNGWLRRRRHDRALDVTDEGRQFLRRYFVGLDIPA
ncbi:ArsR/SmtB family transcription factor [Mycolicibacterium palauense]|uniref:ArsR/SmtB family transcription factor n=1 Tax=Mycolicibacterium palauense TaxID=2034511 RepID=UPI000BFEBB5F|nr:helix-turn-helix domain-containing protein [Mycolicibacterium palauense]